MINYIEYLNIKHLSIKACIFVMVCLSYLLTSISCTYAQKRKLIKILAIDGGGVRGIIPAYILNDIENKLPNDKKLAEHFDIIAGTSAGGILALLLTTPDEYGKPRYDTQFILDSIESFSKKSFATSFFRKLSTGNGLWHVKYSSDNIKDQLDYYFGNVKLNKTTTNVIIPAYEIESDMTFFFKTSRAKNESRHNCFIKDLAYATSAAPTYFPPQEMNDDSGRKLYLIDGGVSTNNPSLAAVVHAMELYGKDVDLFILSIGTGTTHGSGTKNLSYKEIMHLGGIGWLKHIIPLMMYASNQVIDYEMYYIFNHNKPKYYYRFQVALDHKHSEMDNVSEENIEALKQYAKDTIEKYSTMIDEIIPILSVSR